MRETDPFAALENEVKRQDLEERAHKALTTARAKLILGRRPQDAFFATLALRLDAQADWDCETAATDGKSLFYNPEWFVDLPQQHAIGIVTHEIMHCVLGHQARRGARNEELWNIAADLAVNPLLVNTGFDLPSCRLMPGEGKYKDLAAGLSAEEYYALLQQPPQPNNNKRDPQPPGGGGAGSGDGNEPSQDGSDSESASDNEPQDEPGDPDPGGCGSVQSPPDHSPAATRQSEAEWKVAAAQAQQIAKQRGDLPGGLGRAIEEVLQPKVDWRDVLREFVSSYARNDYTWSPPNRRYIHAGLYLPGLRSEELGDVVLAVDTSGSIGEAELSRFAAEAQGILESYDCKLTILYHDARITATGEWQPSDGPLKLEPKGGGGTSHIPVFDHIEQTGMNPICLVCLTDLYSCFPASAPAYPVLWAAVGASGANAPFGIRVDVE